MASVEPAEPRQLRLLFEGEASDLEAALVLPAPVAVASPGGVRGGHHDLPTLSGADAAAEDRHQPERREASLLAGVRVGRRARPKAARSQAGGDRGSAGGGGAGAGAASASAAGDARATRAELRCVKCAT
ncbi:hypothetical protein G6O69_15785 [Pseudenhygromyxa sp. WMMC2535]|uniref:hypothetical protein n=1 Tax=Pseudenhygromyxa sp. WMMC2535 TaxID=2712867 RepID=UPI0015960113|nr:hypothetical protein [Pseudenhygromyxa sp. WMMC2535]NVB39304.1 hypothetical protein [Pseudenhygromyxa sp. WMMC2535]